MEDPSSKGLEVFLLSKLGMLSSDVAQLGETEITPVGQKGPGAIHHECIVLFSSKDRRDLVRSNASKLGLLPKDTAGIRLELPDFLQNNFKILQNAAYQIKKKTPGAKRNVLFDDDNLDLALDVNLGGAAGAWERIFPSDARTAGARAGRGPNARKHLDPASISGMMSSQ